MKAIRIHKTGGPEVLTYEDAPEPQPGAGEAVVKVEAIGVNFIDVYFRIGLYKAPNMPFTPGMEASGTVSAVGSGVTDVQVGDRVAYAMNPGAYGQFALAPAWKLVKLPAGVDFKQGAAAFLEKRKNHF